MSTPEGGPVDYTVVIPTIGRDCLHECLRALAASHGPSPERVVIVDDRPGDPDEHGELSVDGLGALRDRATVLHTGGGGPAAARNAGRRAAAHATWTVFLDDDVRVTPQWRTDLVRDLAAAGPRTGGVQGVLRVPLPAGRAPTDWERGTAGLQTARWATADMAYRTRALQETGGFDERFPRAFREDADLALRMLDAGWLLRRGRRVTEHPVRNSDRWASVRAQRGNADDALMLRLHGPQWWQRAEAPRGRIRGHAQVTACAAAALALGVAGRPRAAVLAACGWALGTAAFARVRIAPGPRTREEVLTMLTTSVLIPPLAVWHRLDGTRRWRRVPRAVTGTTARGAVA